MSHYSKVPHQQSPRAQRELQPEETIEETLSPSSSSSETFTEEQNTLRDRTLPLSSGEAPAPQPHNLGNGAAAKKQHSSSHFHNAQAPHLHTGPDPAYLDRLPTDQQSLLGSKQRIFNKARRFWTSNRSYLLVIMSTLFGSLMTLLTKLLESEEQGMHVFQILWCRMTVSWLVCAISVYYAKPAEFPFGPRKVRWLLITRGICGFIGIGSLWTALNYLNLSDATVITFLTPSMIAGYSAIFLNEPFPRKEMAASCVALLGVVFIARPVALFGAAPTISNVPSIIAGVGDGQPMPSPIPTTASNTADDDTDEVQKAAERLVGIALCVTSAVGGAGALLSVKRIGTRASVLTTTSYFALISTLITTTTLLLAPWLDIGQPQLHFALPRGSTQWLFVSAITVCGLATQLLMTLGVGGEGRSSRAPAMLYTGMLWTAGFDRLVFGKDMHWTSVVGCGLIVGGAVFIALQPKPQAVQLLPVPVVVDVEEGNAVDEVFELDPLDSDSDA